MAPGQGAEERVHQMLAGVRAAGLKLTPQRIAIVRELAADPSHPTAQEIFDRLQSSMPTMSFATVYNTLDALARAGLCGSLSLSPGPARFDPNMAPHHHAVCDGCGLVRDVPHDGAASGPKPQRAGRAFSPATEAADHNPRRAGRAFSPATEAFDHNPALTGFEVRTVEHIYRGLCAACSARSTGLLKSESKTRRRDT